MRLVFMGSPEFAVLPLRSLHRAGYEIVAVYTKMDKPSGRGQEIGISPIKREALALGLTVVQTKSLRNPEVVAEIARLEPDIIVVAAYGQILPLSVLNLPRYGCLNIHPSLLPRHRGAAPVVSTLLAGDMWGGTSIMLMGEGLDTGPVLAQASVLIRDEDTGGLLSDKLSLISAQMLLDVLPSWVCGATRAWPQDNNLATYFKTMVKESGEIDWKLSALEIWRQVRAFQPWPGAFTHYLGKTLKIIEVKPLPCLSGEAPGRVISIDKSFGIVAGDGVLGVSRIQIEGRHAMDSADFLRGQRAFLGTLLPS